MDHGDVDDIQIEHILGAMIVRVLAQLRFAGTGAVARTGFSIDDVSYEVSVTVKA